jgi:transposase
MAGRGRVTAVAIELSEDERRELDGLTRRRKSAQGLARRAQIVLAAAEGLQNKPIVARLGVDANTVGKWRRRFAERRLAGLYDEPRPGAPRRIGDDAIAATVQRTLEETPPDATHWLLRSMARAAGYAPSTIHRIWKAIGLQPHRTETFKLSSDPFFVEVPGPGRGYGRQGRAQERSVKLIGAAHNVNADLDDRPIIEQGGRPGQPCRHAGGLRQDQTGRQISRAGPGDEAAPRAARAALRQPNGGLREARSRPSGVRLHPERPEREERRVGRPHSVLDPRGVVERPPDARHKPLPVVLANAPPDRTR